MDFDGQQISEEIKQPSSHGRTQSSISQADIPPNENDDQDFFMPDDVARERLEVYRYLGSKGSFEFAKEQE